MNSDGLENIAVIGLAGRFPGADNLQQFWQNLANGKESLTNFTDEDIIKAGVNPTLLADPRYVKSAPMIENAETFDAAFFGFSPREAEITDPQQRIFLECAWEALEDSGYSQTTENRSIGLYAGVGFNGYLLFNLAPYFKSDSFAQVLQYLVGNDKDYLATHTSYKLNLRGPSMVVQTACSSSLVAVAQACQSLLNYQCDMALAGGVTVRVPRRTGYLYEEGGVFAKDGHCRAFDAQGSGTIYGDGVGIVVLKRLSDALADNDNIYAVIKGFGVNNDGNSKVSYTAPSVEGQAEAIAMAHAMADIEPETITFIEAHGTGTQLGDPIEIAALKQVFAAGTDRKSFCAIGSVKTNVGHLDGAAGVVSLIKAILALKHKQIPASLHFTQPNPQIDFANSPFYVNTQLKDWTTNSIPRRAGVSSFGFGGTNAHLILEEAPTRPLSVNTNDRTYHILTLSAKTSTALRQLAKRYYQFLQENSIAALADICFTANTGRTHLKHRLAVLGATVEDIAQQLFPFLTQDITATQASSLAQISLNKNSETAQLAVLIERYINGENIDWIKFDKPYRRYRVALPTYPFERQRYWIDEKIVAPVTTGESLENAVYTIDWLPKALTIQPLNNNMAWLIFADQQGIADGIQKSFTQQGIKSILIKPGESWITTSATEWSINPKSQQDYEYLKAELDKHIAFRHCGVIYLGGLNASHEPTDQNLVNEQAVLCGSVIHIFQNLEKFIQKFWLITAGAMAVPNSTKPLILNQSPLLGLSKVIALEYENVWAGLIDLDMTATQLENIKRIEQELYNNQLPEYITYQNQQRLVARLKPQPRLAQKRYELFDATKTYLITGGLGGLGLKLAAWLIERGVKHLVLVGRQAPTAMQQTTIQSLQTSGCNVIVMQADVSQRNDVAVMLEKIATTMPPLVGIFHLAGQINIATIKQLNWQEVQQVLAPKLAGSWYLHELTRHLPLELFVMFSSISSVIGAFGTASYACANAFLDGLAHYRKSLGLPALSINWGAWAEVGMTERLAINHNQVANDFAFKLLSVEKGLHYLQQLLQADACQMSVMTVDWYMWSRQLGLNQPFFEQVLPNTNKLNESSKTPELQALFCLPATQQKEQLAKFVQQLVANILKLPASALPNMQQPFSELGMDSLMAIELRNQLEVALGKKLSATLMFNNRNITALTDYLLEQVFIAPASAINEDKISDTKAEFTANEIAKVKALSDEQILQQITKEFEEIK